MNSIVLFVCFAVGVSAYRLEERQEEARKQFPLIGVDSKDNRQIVPPSVLRNYGLLQSYGNFPAFNGSLNEVAKFQKEMEYYTTSNKNDHLKDIPSSTVSRLALTLAKPEWKDHAEWILAHSLNSAYALLMEIEGYFGIAAEEIYKLKTGQSEPSGCPASDAVKTVVLKEECLTKDLSEEEWERLRLYAATAKDMSLTARLSQELLNDNSLTFGMIRQIPSFVQDHKIAKEYLKFFFEHNETVISLKDTYLALATELSQLISAMPQYAQYYQ